MAEEPQFPPLPDIGDILERKDRFKQKKTAVLKCRECKAKYPREFKEGDYVFKNLKEEKCKECNRDATLTIEEIYAEWFDPKKEK